MANDDDRLAALSRVHSDGWRSGFIDGALYVIGMSCTQDDVMRELIRRFGPRDVEFEVRKRPHLREAFERAQSYIATGDTQPIDLPLPTMPPSDANSPQGVGGKDEPGGWTGGLTHPPNDDTPRRGRRR